MWSVFELELKGIKLKEVECRVELENIVKEREQRKRNIEKLKELEKENMKFILMVMDEWIYN